MHSHSLRTSPVSKHPTFAWNNVIFPAAVCQHSPSLLHFTAHCGLWGREKRERNLWILQVPLQWEFLFNLQEGWGQQALNMEERFYWKEPFFLTSLSLVSSESIETTFFSPLSKHFYENSSHFPALTLIWSALAATRCSKCSPGPGTRWASPERATEGILRGFLEKNGISGESQNGLGWQESEIIQFQPCRGCSIRIKLQGPRRRGFPWAGYNLWNDPWGN